MLQAKRKPGERTNSSEIRDIPRVVHTSIKSLTKTRHVRGRTTSTTRCARLSSLYGQTGNKIIRNKIRIKIKLRYS